MNIFFIFRIFYYFTIFYSTFININCCCHRKKLIDNTNYANNVNNNLYKNLKFEDKKEKGYKDKDGKDKAINISINEILKSIFQSLSTKKIFFDDNDRKKDDFKHFQFIKNMFPNGDNRCWLICEIIAFFNTHYIQEILLNNNFDDNIYLKSLQKLLLDCRNKNNKKQQLNCDEFTKLIDDYINRNCIFYCTLYKFNFASERKNRKINSFIFKNFSEFTIMFKEDITNVINLDKIKNLDPILYSIKESLNYEIDIKFIGTNRLLEYCNMPFQDDENDRVCSKIMYIFSDKNTEDHFFEILKVKNKKKLFYSVEDFYKFFEDIFNKIKENFKFECNSIIMISNGYHYFSFCKNLEDNNWYNFNSLDGQYGEICNDTIDKLIKDKKLTISGHEYIPDLFIISVSQK